MNIEGYSIGNVVYDEEKKIETTVTADILKEMQSSLYNGRYKPVMATKNSIVDIGFTVSPEKPEPGIIVFVSPTSIQTSFQLIYIYSEVHRSGGVYMFNRFPVPLQFLHEIQNLYIIFAKEKLKYNKRKIKKLFKITKDEEEV